jgi:hypothetical protein
MTELAQIIGAVAVLLSVALNFYFGVGERRRRDRERESESREWYNRTLFQHRLDSVHSAFAWLMKLNRLLNVPSPDQTAIRVIQREAREWYDLHTFYLEERKGSSHSSHFVGACNSNDYDQFRQHFDACYQYLSERSKELMRLGGADRA